MGSTTDRIKGYANEAAGNIMDKLSDTSSAITPNCAPNAGSTAANTRR